MSFKLRFSYSHRDFFEENLGDFCKENGKIFHQAIQQKKAVSGPVAQRNDGRLQVVIDKGRYM